MLLLFLLMTQLSQLSQFNFPPGTLLSFTNTKSYAFLGYIQFDAFRYTLFSARNALLSLFKNYFTFNIQNIASQIQNRINHFLFYIPYCTYHTFINQINYIPKSLECRIQDTFILGSFLPPILNTDPKVRINVQVNSKYRERHLAQQLKTAWDTHSPYWIAWVEVTHPFPIPASY